MNYEEKVIFASLCLGLGLVILAAYAWATKPILFPFAIILALIGGYISFYPPSIFTYIQKLGNKKEAET